MNDEGMASMGGGGGVEGVVDLYQGEGGGTGVGIILYFLCFLLVLFFSSLMFSVTFFM